MVRQTMERSALLGSGRVHKAALSLEVNKSFSVWTRGLRGGGCLCDLLPSQNPPARSQMKRIRVGAGEEEASARERAKSC